jgi:hypothetical protein
MNIKQSYLIVIILLICITLSLQCLSTPNFLSYAMTLDPKAIYLPIIMNNYDPSIQWEPMQEVQIPPTSWNNPMGVIDTSGKLHLFWDATSSSQAFIYHRYQTDSGWSAIETIAPTLGTSSLITLPVAALDGSIHIIWRNVLNFGGPYRIMYAIWKNGTWSQEAELHRTPANSIGGRIGVDSNSRPHVVIYSSDNYLDETYYDCTPSPTGCQSKTVIPVGPLTYDMFIDNSGGVVIMGDGYWGGVKKNTYSYWKAGKIVVAEQQIGGDINFRSGLMDQQNNITYFRTDSMPVPGGNVSGLYRQCLSSNHTWNAEEVLSGQENISSHQAINTSQNNVVSAWQASKSGFWTMTWWNNCAVDVAQTISVPPPSSGQWDGLRTLVASDQPKKICMALGKNYSKVDYWVYCANLSR